VFFEGRVLHYHLENYLQCGIYYIIRKKFYTFIQEYDVSRYCRKVKIFSALEVANVCGVVNQTAINWIKSGHLKAFTTPGGQYRVYAKDLAAFLDKRGMADSGEALNVFLEKADWYTLLAAAGDQALGNRIKEELENTLLDHEVLLASDGFELGRILAETKPGFIIIDMAFPGVDHSRLIRTLKEDLSFGKPFVFIMNQPDSAEAPPNSDGVFSLPEEINRLAESIRSMEKQAEPVQNIG
jgi:excisionase family DNA binding protein